MGSSSSSWMGPTDQDPGQLSRRSGRSALGGRKVEVCGRGSGSGGYRKGKGNLQMVTCKTVQSGGSIGGIGGWVAGHSCAQVWCLPRSSSPTFQVHLLAGGGRVSPSSLVGLPVWLDMECIRKLDTSARGSRATSLAPLVASNLSSPMIPILPYTPYSSMQLPDSRIIGIHRGRFFRFLQCLCVVCTVLQSKQISTGVRLPCTIHCRRFARAPSSCRISGCYCMHIAKGSASSRAKEGNHQQTNELEGMCGVPARFPTAALLEARVKAPVISIKGNGPR
jgi:hypothetical protein